MSVHLKIVLYKAALLSMVVGLLGFTIALAASGDLDTTFSGDGQVTTKFSEALDWALGIAMQADGKIVAVGQSTNDNFALVRYNSNGTLDTTFSGDGRQTTNFGGIERANDVAVQPDSKIVAAGSKCVNDTCDLAVARYNSNGTLDPTFSGDGRVVNNSGGGDNGANRLALQPDGKIVIAGYRHNGTDYDFAIYRYNTNGTPDTTFSGDGVAVGNFGTGNFESALALVIQSDGKFVVAGESNGNFAIARLNSNGTADMTFSGDGRQTTNFGGNDRANNLALQPDDKIVVVGKKCSTICSFAIARYTTNGSLDTTFNTTGRKVFTFVPGKQSQCLDLLVMSDGKIVVAGNATVGTLDFGIARLLPSGAFDTSFSGDGKVTIDFGSNDLAYALARQPADGKYVLAGTAFISPSYDFALARVLP